MTKMNVRHYIFLEDVKSGGFNKVYEQVVWKETTIPDELAYRFKPGSLNEALIGWVPFRII